MLVNGDFEALQSVWQYPFCCITPMVFLDLLTPDYSAKLTVWMFEAM